MATKNRYDTTNLAPMLQVHIPLIDVEDPGDSDVLCGRGGAALRHPGNQTYRRLVHLNKGLYITCLKAEKLKISRSIVAAIRDQQGRFLEKNITQGKWFEIGDKKAIEKTSQALREGQPKLRQKMVELGGGAAGATAFLEHQIHDQQPSNGSQSSLGFNTSSGSLGDFHVNGSGPPPNFSPSGFDVQGFHTSSNRVPIHLPPELSGNAKSNRVQIHLPPDLSSNAKSNRVPIHLPPELSDNTNALRMHHSTGSMGGPGVIQRNNLSMSNNFQPTPPGNDSSHLMGMSEELLQQLSISDSSKSIGSNQQPLPTRGPPLLHEMGRQNMIPSLTQRGSAAAQALGIDESTLNLMSNISANNGASMNGAMNTPMTSGVLGPAHNQMAGMLPPPNIGSFQRPSLEVPQNPDSNFALDDDESASDDNDESDEDEYEKKPPPISQQQRPTPNDAKSSSTTVKTTIDRRRFFAKMKFRGAGSGRNLSSKQLQHSQRSLTSGASDGMPDIHLVESNRSLVSGMSESTEPERGGEQVTPGKNMFGRGIPSVGDVFSGSRRSLMSGLSKISDGTDSNSIISDLSKKMGPLNVSTRSLLSEISGMDESESLADTRDLPQPTPIANAMHME